MPDNNDHIEELEKLVEENRKAFERANASWMKREETLRITPLIQHPPRPGMRVSDGELLGATNAPNGG